MRLFAHKVEYLVVHCSATREGVDIGAAEIRGWHKAKGWADIGYHFVIRLDGTVETGRPLDQQGAHVESYNNRSIGICMVGGVDANDIKKAEDNFTVAQKEALRGLMMKLQKVFPKAKMLGHRDFPGVQKACPCFDVQEWAHKEGLI